MFIKHKNNRDVCFKVQAYIPERGDLIITGVWVNVTSATPFVIDLEWSRHTIKGHNLPEWLLAKDAETLDDLIEPDWVPLEIL